MSPEVEPPLPVGRPPRAASPTSPHTTSPLAPPPPPPSESAPGAPHPPHHVLRDGSMDRWRWRARIRRSPHQLRVYRVCVGVAGLLLILLGFVTGPLPGPGGIPLVLAGLAVWASEFVWAARLMVRFKGWLHTFRSWPRRRQVLVVTAVVVGFLLCGYGYLVLMGGAPGWMPDLVHDALARLPGL